MTPQWYRCPSCGGALGPGAASCPACGARFAQPTPGAQPWVPAGPSQPPAGVPPYAVPPYAAPAAGPAAKTELGRIAGLLALGGGLVAIASGWLPWVTYPWATLWSPTNSTDLSTLHCCYYLVAGGAIAAVCGALLLLRAGRGTRLPRLLGIGAIAGGALVIAVEVSAYSWINDFLNIAAGDSVVPAMGYGLYVGVAGGLAGAIGGLLALAGRR